MNTGTTISDLCALVESKICMMPDCPRLGKVCFQPGCTNRVCRDHETIIDGEVQCRDCVREMA